MGGLGWSEILVIFVLALIVFGPRKLPELGRSLGKGLSEFKKASNDLRRTWEQEVEAEKEELSEEFRSLEKDVRSAAREPLENEPDDQPPAAK